jgi:hypothetical protein
MFNTHVKEISLSEKNKVYDKLMNHQWEKLFEETAPCSANFKSFVEAIEN